LNNHIPGARIRIRDGSPGELLGAVDLDYEIIFGVTFWGGELWSVSTLVAKACHKRHVVTGYVLKHKEHYILITV
jgi:hypothetical protein